MSHLGTAPPLIGSKLRAPRPNPHHIPRQRLLDQLAGHADRPLTLLCAPAGSGKSSLLCDWVATTNIPCAWVSLDERDNEPVVFLNYVLAAIQLSVPGVNLETRDLLKAPETPPLETLAISLSNDLDRISTDFLLVLDDYHVITNPQIDALLLQLLRHPPQSVHLIVATRSEPPWPLAQFRARDQMAELRFADLQFTVEEMNAFVRKALGDAIDEDLIAIMQKESEGWGAGLQLMTLVARQEGGNSHAWRQLGATDNIGAYLFGEVLAQQPAHIQDRLLQMSILPRFSASLCEAVLDRSGNTDDPKAWGKPFLAHLERLNLFIIALDVRHEYFRFHHLFQQFLRERLSERTAPERIAALHHRASDWFEAHGFTEEAIDHALAAGDGSAAAELVARHRHDLYNQEQFARLSLWLRLLPLDVKQHQPELLLAEALLSTINWRFTEATVFLNRAEDELAKTDLEQSRARVAAGELAILRARINLWEGNAETLLSNTQRALELLPIDSYHLQGLAHHAITAAYWLLGDSYGAQTYVAGPLAAVSPQLPMYATLLQTQGFLHWMNGDLPLLLDLANRLLTTSHDLDLPDQKALAHFFLGIAHFAQNALTVAEQELTAAFAARFNLRLMWWCQAAGMLALTYQALGQTERARETLAQANDFLLERKAVRLLPNLGAFQAELDRLQGNLADASAWAAWVEPGPMTLAITAVDPRLTQARIFLSQERVTGTAQASALLAELRAFYERVPSRRMMMEIEALTVLRDERLGQHEEALENLQRLVLLTEPIRWVRLFVDLGETMAQLLSELAMRRVAPHTIQRILDGFRACGSISAPDQPIEQAELLTLRERQIMAFLRANLSNKEIAERLYIAPSTVKRHTLSIYRKLGVNDRREAVVRARDLGLVPAE